MKTLDPQSPYYIDFPGRVRALQAEMGRTGAELLFGRLNGDERPPQRIVLPTRLVPRGSGEIAGEPGP